MTHSSQDDSRIGVRSRYEDAQQYAKARLDAFVERFRYDKKSERNQLEDWYVCENKILADDKRLGKWYDKLEIDQQKQKEKSRVEKAKKDYEDNFKQRLQDLYVRQFNQAKNEFGRDPLGSLEDETDKKISDALRLRAQAMEHERHDHDFLNRVTNEIQGKATISSVDKADNLSRGEINRYARGIYNQPDYPNLPRDVELKWYEKQKAASSRAKNICQRNLEKVLDTGQEDQEMRHNLVDKNGDVRRYPVYSRFLSDSLLNAGSYLGKNFAKHVGNVFQSPGDRRKNIVNEDELKDWAPYRRAKELGFDKVKHFVDKVNAINDNELSGKLRKMLDFLRSEREAIRGKDSIREKYLDDLIEKMTKDLQASEKKIEDLKKDLDKAIKDKDETLKSEMQRNLDSQNDKLKWHLFCMFLMASPFAQGLMVAGPLFEYLDFLGDILGPVFMHPDGFATGFAQALENFPLLGDLLRLIRVPEGLEFLFNETPVLSAITGNDGIITGLTRNGIFEGIATSINYDILYLPIAGGAAFYLLQDKINDAWGDKTGNTDPSVKMIREKYLNSIRDSLESKKSELQKLGETQPYGVGKIAYEESKKYIKNSAIAHSFADALKQCHEHSPSKFDEILGVFDGIKIKGQDNQERTFKEHVNERLKNNPQLRISDIMAEEQMMSAVNKAILEADSKEDGKRMAILSDIHLNEQALNSETLKGLKGSELESSYKKADNNYAMRFYMKEYERLGMYPDKTRDLLAMRSYNELQQFDQAKEEMEKIDEFLAAEITRKNIENGREFEVAQAPPRPPSPYVHPREVTTRDGSVLFPPPPPIMSR